MLVWWILANGDSCHTWCANIIVCMCCYAPCRQGIMFCTSAHAVCNNSFMGRWTCAVFIPHMVCCGTSPYTVMELLMCLQHLRREKLLLIRLLWVVLQQLCLYWLRNKLLLSFTGDIFTITILFHKHLLHILPLSLMIVLDEMGILIRYTKLTFFWRTLAPIQFESATMLCYL